jgi:hypothetical protein
MKTEWTLITVVIATLIGGIVSLFQKDAWAFGCAMFYCTLAVFFYSDDEKDKKEVK